MTIHKNSYVMLLLMFLSGCTGGGETVVSGFGNSGNYFGVDAEVEMLANEFATSEKTPLVTDEELQKIHQVIMAQALAGDLRSSVVIYKLATKQKKKAEEAEG